MFFILSCFVEHEPLEDPLDSSKNSTTNTPNPTNSHAKNNHTLPFTVSSPPFSTPPMCNCRTFEHLILEIGPYVASSSTAVASSSTAATSSTNKSFEELFHDRAKPNPTKKDKGKSKRVFSRAQERKLLPNKYNVGITKNTSC